MVPHGHSTMTGQSTRFGRIPGAIARTGVRRTKLYELAKRHPGLFKKDGAVTIVDLQKLDEVLAELPPAEFKDTAAKRDTAA
jgi:hypothetical protein